MLKKQITFEADNWIVNEENSKYVSIDNGEMVVDNTTSGKIIIKYKKRIDINEPEIKFCHIKFYGDAENAGGYIRLNSDHMISINSETALDLTLTPPPFYIELEVSALSKVKIKELTVDFYDEKQSLLNGVSKENDVLIIVPNYPSYENLYYCAFAHSRNKEYVKEGIKAQVFAVNDQICSQNSYEIDGVPVFRGTYADLKELLVRHQFKTIVVHFVDEKLYSIFDGNIYNNEQLIFICHGPETVYRYLVDKTKPYFTKPLVYPMQCDKFDMLDYYVKKYAGKDNVEWVFVSDWLKEFSEEEQKLKFKNSRVINNIMDEELFPYTERDAEMRKKIIVIRKFDDVSQHSIDQVVYAILELSRRDFFDDLTFEIYGDGSLYDTLTEPIKNFKNIKLFRTFIPNNEIEKIYRRFGILLLPSRHDAHAVSMGEGAATGLAVVGSNVTSNPYFMNEKENHTLAGPEDFKSLADIIERLYRNPDEFLKISGNMAKFTRQFCRKNTVQKEVELIREQQKKTGEKLLSSNLRPTENPVLTVGVPAYNVEAYIEKTLFSVLNQRNAGKLEVLVINDGSTDKTSEIVKEYIKLSGGIVRLIEKENGGHGSGINRAVKEARGKYFRLVDGDDWVDSENLAKLVDIMETSEADIILTTASYDYVEKALFDDIISYDNLKEGITYNFDDLTYENYGFEGYGPLLTTGNYKTEPLKDAGFTLSEKKPYVDMEYNAFSLKKIKTLVYYDLNIYRYLIGREGQTISRDFWRTKYQDHEYIIFNILEKVYGSSDFSERKLSYIYKNIIAPMVDTQIFMFDSLCLWKNIPSFLEKLKKYPGIYDLSINFIEKKDGNCRLILHKYKSKLRTGSKKPIIIPGVRETMEHGEQTGITVKKLIKAALPGGFLYIYRKAKKI